MQEVDCDRVERAPGHCEKCVSLPFGYMNVRISTSKGLQQKRLAERSL